MSRMTQEQALACARERLGPTAHVWVQSSDRRAPYHIGVYQGCGRGARLHVLGRGLCWERALTSLDLKLRGLVGAPRRRGNAPPETPTLFG